MRVHTSLVVLVVLAALPAAAQPVNVQPLAETQTVARAGNAPQDVALWPNSADGGASLFIVADSAVGLITFQLDGREYQALLSDGLASGVDVREGFALPGGSVPLVVAANGTLQALTAYVVDPSTRQLRRVDTGGLRVAGFSPTTVTLYRSPATGTLFAFTANAAGTMQQFELRSNMDGGVEGVPVRDFAVGGAVAGAVADDEQGFLFVAQQNAGIWRYAAEPDAGTTRVSVATATAPLTAPLGGLGLYALPGNKGYLLAASEGGDQVVIFGRQPPHSTVGSFMVVQNGGIDAVTGPTTVEATSRPLGPNFPSGFIAVHDGVNAPIPNDKFVSWATLATAFTPPLQIPTDGGTPDGGTSETTDGGKLPGGSGPGSGQTFPPDDSGCGCTMASVPGTLLFVVAGLALRGRRRKS